MSIWMMRLALSKTLFNFFGYLSPALNSTKSIISRDEEGIREYLTYWCVFGLLLYVEFILNFFSALRNWPPESKVIVVLWLTLPQFQGAFRIYGFVLRPYFEKYEDEIDKQINNISRGVSEKAHRHIQTILWQLFLAPNDGLLAALSLTSLPSFSSTNLITSFLKSNIEQTIGQNSQNGESRSERREERGDERRGEQVDKPQQRVTSFSLRKQLLQNFSEMLVDGIYADVRHNYRSHTSPPYHPSHPSHSSYSSPSILSVESEMVVSKVVLMRGGYYLQLSKQNLDKGDITSGEDREESHLHDCLNESSCEGNTMVPLFLVANVSSDNRDPNLILMTVSTGETKGEDEGKDKGDVRGGDKGEIRGGVAVVHMRAENEEEGEALLAGMIVLCADTKKRVTKMMSRAIELLRRGEETSLPASLPGTLSLSLAVAFHVWCKRVKSGK